MNTTTVLCDLHTHSVFSDGTKTPAELIALAKKSGLSALALTDHNTTGGLPELAASAEKAGLPVSCGTEITTQWQDCEIHLVGHFLTPSMLAPVEQYLQQRNFYKEESTRQAIDLLRRDGFDLTWDGLQERFPDLVHNRLHIVEYLREKGCFASVTEGFEKLFYKGSPYLCSAKRLSYEDTVVFLREIGAVPVAAHPLLNVERARMPEFLACSRELGLIGAEVRYSLYSAEDTAFMEKQVKEAGLLPSGGSDFHGSHKPDIALGAGKGGLSVPYEYFAALRSYAAREVQE